MSDNISIVINHVIFISMVRYVCHNTTSTYIEQFVMSIFKSCLSGGNAQITRRRQFASCSIFKKYSICASEGVGIKGVGGNFIVFVGIGVCVNVGVASSSEEEDSVAVVVSVESRAGLLCVLVHPTISKTRKEKLNFIAPKKIFVIFYHLLFY